MAAEAKTRHKTIRYAKGRGVPHIRLAFMPGVAVGWPDDIFLIWGGRPLLMEFKGPGCVPSPIQLRRHEQLRGLGYDVAVCDDFDAARRAISQALDTAALHAARLGLPGGPGGRVPVAGSGDAQDVDH